MRRAVLVFFSLLAPLIAMAGTKNCTSASYAETHPPKYPANAVAGKIEGLALIAAIVESDGPPVRLEVRKSSGNAELDQAALDSVAKWRFNAMRCDGKATRSVAMVPMEFSLDTTISDSSEDSSLETVLSRPGLMLRNFDILRDDEPLEFSSIDEGLQFLRGQPGVEERATKHDATFYRFNDMRIWAFVQAVADPAPGPANRMLLRQRWRVNDDATVILIVAMCEGDKLWCGREIGGRIAFMKEHPPPPPPTPLRE
jgi:TonB family protein